MREWNRKEGINFREIEILTKNINQILSIPSFQIPFLLFCYLNKGFQRPRLIESTIFLERAFI